MRKGEKGSATLLVFVTVMLIIVLLGSILTSVYFKNRSQLIELDSLRDSYAGDKMEDVFKNKMGVEADKFSSATVWNYDYTGNVQEFIAPYTGTYKLETWGAQGGTDPHGAFNSSDNYGYHGGYGAYSTGSIKLEKGTKLYVFVGEQGYGGKTEKTGEWVGSYPNGGATIVNTKDSNAIAFSSGGGSTHIALKNKKISELESEKDSIIIVSGAGGGTSNWWNSGDNGGNGGGFIGGSTTKNFNDVNATGGTQNHGGYFGGNANSNDRTTYNAGKFGIGGGKQGDVSGAGGGGYYGGGASWGGSGAGGSGYIANSLLFNKHMTGYEVETSNDESTKTISNKQVSEEPKEDFSKVGNGYAKITLENMDESKTSNWSFGYTGDVQKFTAPKDGIYKLETWGAQGGNAYLEPDTSKEYDGGYGAYSTGIINLKKGQTIYITVGGKGKMAHGTGKYKEELEGGYNGGGKAYCYYGLNNYSTGSGGGATHISLSNKGELSNYQDSKDQLLIVSGGGGGSLSYYDPIKTENRTLDYLGSAGGINGSSPLHTNYGENYKNRIMATGGTQNKGGSGDFAGTFGKGGEGTDLDMNSKSGGGGGYYGGAGATWAGASGGSGYIGNSILTDKHMAGYNVETSSDISTKTISVTQVSETPQADTAKKGNGFAKITLVEL